MAWSAKARKAAAAARKKKGYRRIRYNKSTSYMGSAGEVIQGKTPRYHPKNMKARVAFTKAAMKKTGKRRGK